MTDSRRDEIARAVHDRSGPMPWEGAPEGAREHARVLADALLAAFPVLRGEVTDEMIEAGARGLLDGIEESCEPGKAEVMAFAFIGYTDDWTDEDTGTRYWRKRVDGDLDLILAARAVLSAALGVRS